MSKIQPIQNGPDIPTEVKDQELVAKRRRQVVDASVQLFIKKGFHKTTTREIAKAAGFSIGTLYEYVKSKEDVLFLVCSAIHEEVESRLVKKIEKATTGAKALEGALEAYFKVCDQMSDHILLIYQETQSLPRDSMRFVLEHEDRITGIFADLLRQGVEDFTLRPMGQSEILLMAHNIAVLGHMWTFRRWSLARRFSLDEYIEHQRALIMDQLV